jgi:hypothetical protein
MSTGTLQDFATTVIARGQVTFGDVRRLQRDHLPEGITTRDNAEILIALSHKLTRADKAWAQWLAVALARWLGSQDVSVQDTDSLLAAPPAATALGRRIVRTIRRELPKLMADEPGPIQAEPCPAPQIIAAIARSDIIARPRCARVARRKRTIALPMVLLVEVWSAGMMEKHQRFQLERPYL